MKRLDKEQRNTFYIILKHEAKSNLKYLVKHRMGFCHLIYRLIFDSETGFNVYNKRIFKSRFPELYAKKPKGSFWYWFSGNKEGWEKRIELLNQCIIETL